jgi:hypothetical protein
MAIAATTVKAMAINAHADSAELGYIPALP